MILYSFYIWLTDNFSHELMSASCQKSIIYYSFIGMDLWFVIRDSFTNHERGWYGYCRDGIKNIAFSGSGRLVKTGLFLMEKTDINYQKNKKTL